MAYVDWSLNGPEISTCNCDWGCPCQFNSLPTHGDCRAAVAMRIDKGHFGDVKLDGICWVGMFAWPRAIHEGNGEAQVVIDEHATEKQRSAILTILSGQETVPGSTIFNVFSTVINKLHEPIFKPIEFSVDIENRTGHFRVPGIVEAKGEPIRNHISGEPHRARVVLPHGFEYTEAEFASGTAKGTGPIKLDWDKCHAHFTMLNMTNNGVVR